MNAGGLFHAGNSPGEVTTGAVTWGAAGAYEFDLGNATGTQGSDWSFWNMLGALDIAAGAAPNNQFTIDVDSVGPAGTSGLTANFDPTMDYSWVIAEATSINGFSTAEFALNTIGFENAAKGGSFSLAESGNELLLDFTAAPEPGTLGLLLAAAGILVVAAKRPKT